MKRAITPSPKPNHKVQRRMSNVAAPPIAADVLVSKRVSPNILPSAVPNPPGRLEAEPINEDTAITNVALINRSRPDPSPNPTKTKYRAPHSPAHEIRPIRMASNNGRHWNRI